MHNPALITNLPVKGSQYRSAIFYLTKEQNMTALKLVDILRHKKISVNTEISPAGAFYKAEACHQRYYANKGQHDAVRQCTSRL